MKVWCKNLKKLVIPVIVVYRLSLLQPMYKISSRMRNQMMKTVANPIFSSLYLILSFIFILSSFFIRVYFYSSTVATCSCMLSQYVSVSSCLRGYLYQLSFYHFTRLPSPLPLPRFYSSLSFSIFPSFSSTTVTVVSLLLIILSTLFYFFFWTSLQYISS